MTAGLCIVKAVFGQDARGKKKHTYAHTHTHTDSHARTHAGPEEQDFLPPPPSPTPLNATRPRPLPQFRPPSCPLPPGLDPHPSIFFSLLMLKNQETFSFFFAYYGTILSDVLFSVWTLII